MTVALLRSLSVHVLPQCAKLAVCIFLDDRIFTDYIRGSVSCQVCGKRVQLVYSVKVFQRTTLHVYPFIIIKQSKVQLHFETILNIDNNNEHDSSYDANSHDNVF